MNMWWSQTMVQGVGWTLLHFLWQGLVIAALLAIGLRLLRSRPAQHRYLAGCAALLLMTLAPLVTFQLVLKQDEPPPLPVVEPVVAEAPAPVERVALPARTLPKIVVTATREPRAQKTSWRLEPLMPWLVAAWFAGVCGLSCRLFAGWLQVRRLRNAHAEALADGWPEKLKELARRLGVNRPLRLLRTACVEVPTVIGWLRPVILLPAACLTGLTTAQLESIIAHELAHIRRHDYLINLLQNAAETLLFYHPAVWWVSRRIREERENCCDDLVVEVCGDRVGYARALATLEELRPASAQLALTAGGAPLLQRIRRVLGQGERSAGRPAWPLACVLVVVLLAIAGLEWRGHRVQAAASDSMAIDRPLIVSRSRRAEDGNTNRLAPDMDIWSNIPQSRLNKMFWFRSIGSNSLAVRYPWGKTFVLTMAQNTQPNPGGESANESNRVLFKRAAELKSILDDHVNNGDDHTNDYYFTTGTLRVDQQGKAGQFTNVTAGPVPFNRTDLVYRDPWGNPYIVTMDSSNTPAPSQTLLPAAQTNEPPPLETRTFQLDLNTFVHELERATGESLSGVIGEAGSVTVVPGAGTGTNTIGFGVPLGSGTGFAEALSRAKAVQSAIRKYFTAAGVDMSTNDGKAVGFIFNDRSGTLTVRATSKDLAIIEGAVQKFKTPVLEVNIKTKFVEITQKAGDTNGYAFGGLRYDPPGGNTNIVWIGTYSNASNSSSPGNQDYYFATGTLKVDGSNVLVAAGPVNQSGTPKTEAITGILTDPQYRSVLRGLEQLEGVDILTAPEITTESGREAQIQAMDISEIVNRSGSSPATGSNTAARTTVGGPTNPVFNPASVSFPTGPSLDVLATVSADGYAVNLTLIPSVTEFIGYDNPGEFVPQAGVPGGSTLTAVLPLPHFRLRQLVSNVAIWDAQTVVLFGPQQPPRSEHAGEVNKNLIIFVTVTIINPDGTRFHSDEEIPKSGIPPQTGTNSVPKK